MGALLHDEGEHAEDAEGGQQQGQDAEGGEQGGGEPARANALEHDVVHAGGAVDGQGRVDVRDGAADGGQHGQRVAARRAHEKRHVAFGAHGAVGPVHGRALGVGNAELPHAAHHAHDLVAVGVAPAQVQTLAQGVAVREQRVGEHVADHDHVGAPAYVVVGERAPAYQRDAGGREEVGRRLADLDELGLELRVVGRGQRRDVPSAQQRHQVADARILNPRNRLDGRHRAGEELARRVHVLVGRLRQAHAERHGVGRLDARVHMAQPPEAVEQQPGPRGQQHAQGDFARHEPALEPAAGAGHRAPSLPQRVVEPAGVQAQRRHQTHGQAGEQGESDGERHDDGVQAHGVGAGQRPAEQGQQQPRGAPCQRDAQQAGHQGQGQALGQETGDDPPPAGAHGRPQRQLAPPPLAPHQHQVGHVHAADHQHQQHRPGQQPQQPARLAEQHLAEPLRPHRPVLVLVRPLRQDALPDATELRLRRRRRHPRRQPREGGQPAAVAALRHDLLVPRERRHKLRVAREPERGRQHAHDGIRLRIDLERAPQRVGPAPEPLLPQPVRDHDDARRALPVFTLPETAAQCRLHAQPVEEVGRHRHRPRPLRRLFRRQVHRPLHVAHQRLDTLRAATHLQEVRHRVGPPPPRRHVLVPHPDQPIRLRIRQRPEQRALHHAEDRRARADAHRQRQHRRQRVAWPPRQAAEQDARMPRQCSHDSPPDSGSGMSPVRKENRTIGCVRGLHFCQTATLRRTSPAPGHHAIPAGTGSGGVAEGPPARGRPAVAASVCRARIGHRWRARWCAVLEACKSPWSGLRAGAPWRRGGGAGVRSARRRHLSERAQRASYAAAVGPIETPGRGEPRWATPRSPVQRPRCRGLSAAPPRSSTRTGSPACPGGCATTRTCRRRG